MLLPKRYAYNEPRGKEVVHNEQAVEQKATCFLTDDPCAYSITCTALGKPFPLLVSKTKVHQKVLLYNTQYHIQHHEGEKQWTNLKTVLKISSILKT